MLFFPIRTDRQLRHLPVINYSLIAINVFIFLITYRQGASPGVAKYWLNPGEPQLAQYITYQFLHANVQHLLGNMLFLFVFGNSVEDRLGKLAYLFFYLAGGVLAGVGHAQLELAPVLGASGAVAGVSGAYLALFPISNVTIVYWFIFIGTFEISSMVLILFQIAQDAFLYLGQFGGVAYLAHLSGYAFGFLVGIGLLKTGLLAREPYDMLALIEQRRRRSQFQALTRKGYQPWAHNTGSGPPTDTTDPALADPKQLKIMQMRSEISEAITAGKINDAARVYHELLQLDNGQVLSSQHQLDVANQLMMEHRYDTAAAAYELFLKTYKSYGQKEQIELILGLIYGRYLHERDRAKQLLTESLQKLNNPDERDLAKQVLAEVSK